MYRTVQDNFEYYCYQMQGKLMLCYFLRLCFVERLYQFRRPEIPHE